MSYANPWGVPRVGAAAAAAAKATTAAINAKPVVKAPVVAPKVTAPVAKPAAPVAKPAAPAVPAVPKPVAVVPVPPPPVPGKPSILERPPAGLPGTAVLVERIDANGGVAEAWKEPSGRISQWFDLDKSIASTDRIRVQLVTSKTPGAAAVLGGFKRNNTYYTPTAVSVAAPVWAAWTAKWKDLGSKVSVEGSGRARVGAAAKTSSGPLPEHATPEQCAKVIAALLDAGDPRGKQILGALCTRSAGGNEVASAVLCALDAELAKGDGGPANVSCMGAVAQAKKQARVQPRAIKKAAPKVAKPIKGAGASLNRALGPPRPRPLPRATVTARPLPRGYKAPTPRMSPAAAQRIAVLPNGALAIPPRPGDASALTTTPDGQIIPVPPSQTPGAAAALPPLAPVSAPAPASPPPPPGASVPISPDTFEDDVTSDDTYGVPAEAADGEPADDDTSNANDDGRVPDDDESERDPADTGDYEVEDEDIVEAADAADDE